MTVNDIANWMFATIIAWLTTIWFYSTRLLYWTFNSTLMGKDKLAAPSERLLLTSATKLAEQIRRRQISSEELILATIGRIRLVNPFLNAVVQNSFEDAIKRAREIDARLRSGDVVDIEKEPLLGVPFTLKDCIFVKGSVCASGLVSRKNAVSNSDAEVVTRMRNAGAIQLCITNVSEICCWWECSNRLYGQTNNPYDKRCTPGGSSGGEGALIAACGSVIGLGSDIGGSLRMPALFNGIFTIKPSSHIVPDDSTVPEVVGYHRDMHSIGPMCRYAEDMATILKVLAGEKAGRLSLDEPVRLSSIRIFYMEGINSPAITPLSADMKMALQNTVSYMEQRYGCTCMRVDLPLMLEMRKIWFADMLGDVQGEENNWIAQLLADWQGAISPEREALKLLTGGGVHTVPLILLALMEKYGPLDDLTKTKLIVARNKLQKQLHSLLGNDGVLLFPTHPTSAPFHTQAIVQPYNLIYTGVFNSIPLPVAHCPTGLNSAGLPVGVQVVANVNMDRLCLALAMEIESAFGGWQASN